MSTNKTHARGPVGLEGLVIYKYRLYGRGHAVGWFSNKGDENGRVHNYKHSPLPLFLKKH